MAVIDSRSLGSRVAEARRRVGLTQGELAAQITMDRSGLAKVEIGDRRLTALELAQIATAVGERIEWFVSEGPTAIVAHRNLAAPGERSPHIDVATEARVRAVEFVAQHDQRIQTALADLPTFPLPGSDEETEALAVQARGLLHVNADEPLLDLRAKVLQAGVVAFAVDLGADSADAASVLLNSGAVAVVNGALRVGRRRLSLAHELGHVLVKDDYTVDWRTDGSTSPGHRENVMDHFARALLLPRTSVMEAWKQFGGEEGGSWRTASVRTASHFRVDMSTLARRLLDLDAIDATQAARIRMTRTTRADIVEHNLVVSDEFSSEEAPREYVAAVLRLYKAEVVSEARALDLLFGSWEPADLPPLPTLPEDAIWQFVS